MVEYLCNQLIGVGETFGCGTISTGWHALVQLAEALRYASERRGFDSHWGSSLT